MEVGCGGGNYGSCFGVRVWWVWWVLVLGFGGFCDLRGIMKIFVWNWGRKYFRFPLDNLTKVNKFF